MKPKVVYLNHGGFGDTDITILHHLNDKFDLTWFYIDEPLKKVNLSKDEALLYANIHTINIRIKTRLFKIRSIKNIFFYGSIIDEINEIEPDVIYTCINEWSLSLLVPRIKCKNVIHGIHDVKPHTKQNSLKNFLSNWLVSKSIKSYPYSAVFSENQYDTYRLYYGENVTNLGMSVKDFGKSDCTPTEYGKTIDMLMFGYIVKYKGLDILINTLEELYEEGVKCFRLTIAGQGPFWEECKQLIKVDTLYNLKIRFVENSEVPDLMSSHHFLILPYRDATQSGPLLTALNYELPIIAPDFGCFSDTYNSRTGILYEQGNLKSALIIASKMSDKEYKAMRLACKDEKTKFSEESVANNYEKLFCSIVNRKV